MKVYCPRCRYDVTNMKGCIKDCGQYYCKKCNRKVTRQKLMQLIERSKET